MKGGLSRPRSAGPRTEPGGTFIRDPERGFFHCQRRGCCGCRALPGTRCSHSDVPAGAGPGIGLDPSDEAVQRCKIAPVGAVCDLGGGVRLPTRAVCPTALLAVLGAGAGCACLAWGARQQRAVLGTQGGQGNRSRIALCKAEGCLLPAVEVGPSFLPSKLLADASCTW